MTNRQFPLLLFAFLYGTLLHAQRPIQVADFTTENKFRSRSVYGIRWMNDGRYYSALKGNMILQYDITTGNPTDTLLDAGRLSPALQLSDYAFSADEQQILLLTDRQSVYRRSYTAVYYLYNRADGSLRKLAEGRQAYATFSPDGTRVAFTRDNNLYYVELAGMQETAVTTDGRHNHIINGSTDWVYEEELSLTKAFFWSPDSKMLAYFRFDESQVREYNMQVWHQGRLYPEDYRYKYPKAGEANSKVEIYVYHLNSGRKIKVDTGPETDQYIARLDWTPTGLLGVRRLNRLQNRMDLLHARPDSGSTTLVYSDSSDTYVEVEELVYLADGRHFITTSERDGYRHIYLYTLEGRLVRQLTHGPWEVARLVGVRQGRRPQVFYTSYEVSPLEQHFYVVGLNGRGKQQLSANAGVNRINMSRDFKFYLNYHSSATTPNKVTLYRTADNRVVKVLEDNAALQQAAREYGLVPKEYFTFATTDGTELYGYMLKPAGFDPGKKYPVLMYQYSGPGSQSVSNAWGGGHYYWHQMLVQKGYIVVVIDGRGTGGRGVHFKKQTYLQLGRLEVEDQIAGARYLAGQPYVDTARIGIWGWSYGGYMSSLALLRGAEVFAAAIAVAPVTSWRFYDTIYTERFLRTPQENPSGYDDNSPLTHAGRLQGRFLLIHGTGDDNVHVQNSLALIDALVAGGKQFEVFLYPDRAHGIYSRNARAHLYTLMTEFILNNL